MRILVVEDDFVSRNLIARFLAGYGEVATADDGAQGLAALQSATTQGTPYDLVTLDVMMPGLDGHEVLRQLRELEAARPDQPKSKVLMTSALDDLKTVQAAFRQMCDDYLPKPIRRAALYEKLAALGFPPPR